MSQQGSGADKPKNGLKRPIEVVRAELLKDPDTKKIADAVQLKLEEYVELVLKYAQDKDLEPQLTIVSDEDLRKNGVTPVTVDDAVDIVVKGVKGELPGSPPDFEASKFSESKGAAGKPSLSGETAPAGDAAPSTSPQDEAERKALMDQLKRGGGGGGRV
ncbi:hypothetical protein LZ198_35290 [Myxococcus sp. K15C18031901]|uniref:hypothetical protein n=1 Tax=Myxococcus dinghuensis TaxID=2906761 RepID=UPI0020A7F834|nr:hypothetical protein [Myxococcus dinghuensis]MCP3104148.1 hypothetical protein [Myxococcus dinghuensis]